MGEGFLPFAPARSERGELWAAPLLVLLASSRRTTARAADGHGLRGVLSHVLLEAPLPSRFFFPLSSSLGGVSSLLLLCIFFSSGVGQLSASSKTSTYLRYKELCRPPVRASRGQGEPHDASRNENDGRGGVTDDHLRRMRLSRPPRPTYSVSYLYSRVLI